MPSELLDAGVLTQPHQRVTGRIDKAARLERGEHVGEMGCRSRTASTLKPVLVEQRGKGRVAEFGLPQDPVERRLRLLAFAR